MMITKEEVVIEQIEKLAKHIKEKYMLTVPLWEAFVDESDCRKIIGDRLLEIREQLPEFEEHKEEYLDILLSKIDGLVLCGKECNR